MLAGDLLVLQMDGRDTQYVIALDKKTGDTVWKTKRSTDYGDRGVEFRKAFCTPLVIDFGGRRQVVCTGAVETISYDPATGKELWKVRPDKNSYSNTSRPLFCFGHGAGQHRRVACRFGRCGPTAHGDVTDSHVAWKLDKSVPFHAVADDRRRSDLYGQRRRHHFLRRGQDRQERVAEAGGRQVRGLADRRRRPHLLLQRRTARPP